MTQSDVEAKTLPDIKGDEISWAGECPWTGGPCFGSEGGKLYIPQLFNPADYGLGPVAVWPFPVADDVINGVAFSNTSVGVSTANEVRVYERPSFPRPLEQIGFTFDGGAHGITATASGGFIAPLGIDGLLLIDVLPDRKITMRNTLVPQPSPNFYKIASLGRVGRKEIFACAARDRGILAATLDGTNIQQLTGHSLPGLDFIDVCSLRSPKWPLAMAALSTERTLVLSRNVLEDLPRPLHIEGLSGKAYSLLSAKGHIFLLTSGMLVILPNLASRFLENDTWDRPLIISEISIQAVDFYLKGEQTIYTILVDSVLALDIDRVVHQKSQSTSHFSSEHPTSIEPRWNNRFPVFDGAAWEPSRVVDFTVADVC
jgi:hypothetical protein